MKEFDDYQEMVIHFMNPKVLEKKEDMLFNALLGLIGELGEVSELVKKWMYHGHDLDIRKLKKELGDVQFYVSLGASALDERLAVIAEMNVDKLSRRYPNGFTVEDSKAKKDEQPDTENTSTPQQP